MNNPDAELDRVHSFAGLAREYSLFVEQSPNQDIDVRDLARLVSTLVAAGFVLPDLHEDSPELASESDDLAKIAGERFASLANVVYSEVFDPFAEPSEQCVTGSLLDDLQDLYSDLKRGLALYDAGYLRGAAWDWRFHFISHWGEHATSAVRALYWLLRHRG